MNEDQPTLTVRASWRWWAMPIVWLSLTLSRCGVRRHEEPLVRFLVRRGLRLRML